LKQAEIAPRFFSEVPIGRGRPMGMNYSDYPDNWEDIRAEVLERAKNADGISQCECLGECGREHKGTRCLHLQYERLTTRSQYKVILTTAHLCHIPHCDRLDHLKSMCQPCHQVFDLRERQKREDGTTRARKHSAAHLKRLALIKDRPFQSIPAVQLGKHRA
jgi:hypothetical protein